MIKKIGVSVYSPNELNNILKSFEIDVVQLPLNVFDQRFNQAKIVKKLKKEKLRYMLDQFFCRDYYYQIKKD